MPILWQTITWFGGFAAALLVTALMRARGFDWPVTITAAVVTLYILPLAIGLRYSAVIARRRKQSTGAVTEARRVAETKPLPGGDRRGWRGRDPHVFLKCLQNLPTDALQILIDYSALHEEFPGSIIDTSWLPVSKEKLKDVLKLGWLKADNDEARSWIETGWHLLSWAQDGVGPIPINLKTPKSIPIKSLINSLDEQGRWLSLVSAEGEVLAREFDQFKQAVILKEPT